MRFLSCSALLVGFSCACLGANVLGLQGVVAVGSNYLDFGNTLTLSGGFEPAPGSGEFQVTSVTSGSIFATGGVTSGELGMIQSLDEMPGPVSLPSAFMTFGPSMTLPLTATNIVPGSVGPFDLQQTSQGVLATFELSGYIGSNPAENPFSAEFSIGIPGVKLKQLFGDLPVDEPFCGVVATSGSPTACNPFPTTPPTTTPEPSYALIVAAGLLAALIAGKRVLCS